VGHGIAVLGRTHTAAVRMEVVRDVCKLVVVGEREVGMKMHTMVAANETEAAGKAAHTPADVRNRGAAARTRLALFVLLPHVLRPPLR
jgi:hypothetical protein